MTDRDLIESIWGLTVTLWLNTPNSEDEAGQIRRAAFYKVDRMVREAGYMARPVKIIKPEPATEAK